MRQMTRFYLRSTFERRLVEHLRMAGTRVKRTWTNAMSVWETQMQHKLMVISCLFSLSPLTVTLVPLTVDSAARRLLTAAVAVLKIPGTSSCQLALWSQSDQSSHCHPVFTASLNGRDKGLPFSSNTSQVCSKTCISPGVVRSESSPCPSVWMLLT